MADHDESHAVPLTDLSHYGKGLRLKRGIELAGRLVRDHQLGPTRHRLSYDDALPLPSAQLMRICVMDLSRPIEANLAK